MARNQVMKVWTAIVTAFLALCTALGLVTSTAAAAVPQTESARSGSDSDRAEELAAPALVPLPWSFSRSLPPTMKQRIRAEAHGKTPSCRHRAPADTETDESAPLDCAPAAPATLAAPTGTGAGTGTATGTTEATTT
ncbi:DUF6344 domain-containing protein, partial [Streptomyces sp. NPDC003832]